LVKGQGSKLLGELKKKDRFLRRFELYGEKPSDTKEVAE
jgi:hypothetical protein